MPLIDYINPLGLRSWLVLPTPAKMACTLPSELYGHIFNLVGSQSTLYDCRLVCTQWLSFTCQTPIFQKVKVTNDNADDFADLVINSESTLPSCVHHLILDVNPSWLRRLLPFLQTLNNVRCLTLRNLDLLNVGPHVSSQLVATFSMTISKLTLSETTFPCLKDAAKLISQFANLEALVLDGVRWTSPSDSSPLHQDARRGPIIPTDLCFLPWSCTSLTLKNSPLEDLYHWLAAHKPIPQIAVLSIEDVSLQGIIYKRGICHLLAGGIRELTLSYNACPSMQHVVDSGLVAYQKKCMQSAMSADGTQTSGVGLAFPRPSKKEAAAASRMVANANIVLPVLATVRLSNFIYFTDRSRTGAIFYGMESLAFFMCRRVYSQLKKICLGVMLQKAADIDLFDLDWKVLDRLLLSPAVLPVAVDQNSQVAQYDEGLDSVVFEVGGGVDLEAVAMLIAKRLPECSGAGLLRFESVGSFEK